MPCLAQPQQPPLGPVRDSVIAWSTWVTLMGFVGVVALAILVAGPVIGRIDPATRATVTTRLARAAAVAGVLFVPAFFVDTAHDAAGDGGGFAYRAAWDGLFDGTNAGRLLGLEIVLALFGLAMVLPLAIGPGIGTRTRTWLLAGGLVTGATALCTTKFPTEVPEDWSREVFDTGIWFGHLLGGAVWIGGLLGLLVLAAPGGIAPRHRAAFWPPAIRRFSIVAMSCVATIALSGLWLYWMHVDGLDQLVSTMYGRVLGVKLLVFGTMLALGMVNQFWLHPRIEALRATGDDRPLHALLARQFRTAVGLEAVLGLSVLLIAPFLHGSARNQAFQSRAADLTRSVAGVELTRSTLQPGPTEYTVRLTDGSAARVSVTFGSSALGVPSRPVPATRIDEDTYRVSGSYTPRAGAWQVSVVVDGSAAAAFTLPVSDDGTPPKIAPKVVRGSTWTWGVLETLAVIATMVSGFVISGRLARRRTAAAGSAKTAGNEDLLVNA